MSVENLIHGLPEVGGKDTRHTAQLNRNESRGNVNGKE